MKKLLIVFLVCLCFCLFGCNNPAETDVNTTSPDIVIQETTTVSVPSKDLVIRETAGEDSPILNEFTLQDIQSAWGEADEFVEEENAYKWYTYGVKEYIFVFCDESNNITKTQIRCIFRAEVNSDDFRFLVTPCKDERESQSQGEDLCYISLKNGKEIDDFENGTIVQIEYDGIILESDPRKIRAYSVEFCE